jgi:hypothetical protein
MSQADVRLRTFLTCLAIDPYLLRSRRPYLIAATYRTNKTAILSRLGKETNSTGRVLPLSPWRLLTGGVKL